MSVEALAETRRSVRTRVWEKAAQPALPERRPGVPGSCLYCRAPAAEERDWDGHEMHVLLNVICNINRFALR